MDVTPAAVLERATDMGLVSSSAVLAGDAYLVDHSATHHVFEVRGSDHRPRAFVKIPGRAAEVDGDDPIVGEMDAMRVVGGDLAPRLMMTDRHWLWTEPVWPAHPLMESQDLQDFQAWGCALARLHRTSAPPARESPAPWVFGLTRHGPAGLPGHLQGLETDAQGATALRAAQETALRAAIGAAELAWASDRWVHGDATVGNVLVRTDQPPSGRARVALIDWEFAGRGDARWDLATAVEAADRAVPHPQGIASAAVLAGYAGGGGPATTRTDFLIARTVQAALSVAAHLLTSGASIDPALEMLARARTLAHRQPEEAITG